MEVVQTSEEELRQIQRQLLKENRQLSRKRILHNRFIMTGSVILVFMVLLIILTPLIAGDPYAIDIVNKLQAPSTAHVFGTDEFGRDLFTRILYGIRISFTIGFCTAIFSMLIGTALGVYAGYYKIADSIIMRICDGLRAIPSMALAIAFVAVLGSGYVNVILVLTIISIPDVARIVRAETLKIKEQTYVEALKACGASANRIIWNNIVPNLLSPILVQVSFIFANAIVSEAALSFLGVGVPVPTPSLGNIIKEGADVIFKAPWMVLVPGLFIGLSVLALNMLGDGLRDYFDPLSRS